MFLNKAVFAKLMLKTVHLSSFTIVPSVLLFMQSAIEFKNCIATNLTNDGDEH